jgi:SPP1 gp7 family putative phage head morphogenesis protein
VIPPGLSASAHPSTAQIRALQISLRRNAHAVGELAPDVMRTVGEVLAEAQREVVKGLRAWLATGPDAGARYTAQHYRNTLAHLDAAFERIRDLNPTLYNALALASHRAGRLAGAHVAHELARMSQVFEGTVREIPIELVRILAMGERSLIAHYRTSAARYAGAIADDIRRQLALGMVRGETIDQMAKRLVEHGGPRGQVALRGVAGEPGAVVEDIGEGLFRRYNGWADRIARTETQNAYNVQKQIGYRDAREYVPDLKRRWDAAEDLRTCVVCGSMHGEIVGLDEPFSNGVDAPPAHPNCRCSTVPWRDEWPDVGLFEDLDPVEGDDGE